MKKKNLKKNKKTNKLNKLKIRLGVNIDHAATLRQVRNNTTTYPDLLKIIDSARLGGAQQITIHLREDRRHIKDLDVITLCKKSSLPINLEMGVTDEMLKIALKNKPSWVCFVPEKRKELTTEGGLNIKKYFKKIENRTHQLKKAKIKVSFFIEPDLEQVRCSALAGADAVEFHTGHWVLFNGQKKNLEWKKLILAAEEAHSLGLRVHAGHGLDYAHAKLIKKLPHLLEVNIGHSLICYSIIEGLKISIQNMRKCLST